MDILLILLSLLCILAAAVFGCITLVRDIRRKNARKTRWIYVILIAAGILLFLAHDGITQGIYAALSILMLLCLLAILITLIVGIVRRAAFKKKGPVAWITAAAFLVLMVATFVAYDTLLTNRLENRENYEVKIVADTDFEVRDGDTPVSVVTSRGFDSTISVSRYVFDTKDLRLALKDCDVTAEDCIALIRGNPGISREYQDFFVDFVERIREKYPTASLAILYNNLKTLKVIVLSKWDYVSKSLSTDSYGCYVIPENAIYIPEGLNYTEGEWGFQVLLHEFCHAARISWIDEGDTETRLTFCSEQGNTMLGESMNSVFSCSLLHYDEKDIAYQVPSNYLRIMLECVDRYDLSDYMNHSEQYFLKTMDEATGHTNYAQVIWKLITLQRSDYQDDRIDLAPEKYTPIYTYLADLYYGKYLKPDMTEDEKLALADELTEKAFYDAPEGYKIDSDFFTEYLATYEAAHP